MKLITVSYLLGLSSFCFQSVDAEVKELTQFRKKWQGKTQTKIKNTDWREVKFNEPYPKSSTVAYNHATNPNKKQCRNLDSWKVTHNGNVVDKVYSPESDVANAWEAYPGVTSEVGIECRATWNDDDVTFTYDGESDVLTEARGKVADGSTVKAPFPQAPPNFREHCFGEWQVNKCVDILVTYTFTIKNTYSIPQAIFYDLKDVEKKKIHVTLKNSNDTSTFDNYGSILKNTHSHIIQPNQTMHLEEQTFTINTCDESNDNTNAAAFRNKMTLGIFCNYGNATHNATCNHGNNGNLANRCGTADSISFELKTPETPPIITEIARPVINNEVNYVVEIYAPSITNISKNYYFVWIDGNKNVHKQILLNEPNNDGYFVLCQTMEAGVCTHQLSDLSFTGFSSFWITDCESTTTTAKDCTKIDTVNDVDITGKIYRLHNVGDSDAPSGDEKVTQYWVFVDSTSPHILTPGTRDEFGLIITEVTDPSDGENKFIELYSPTGQTNQEIPPVLDLYLIINDGSGPQRLPLDKKPLDENGFVVISIPTDPLNVLSGNYVVSIEKCKAGEGFDNCTVLDVYGVPESGKSDFTGGRAYRLPGSEHDMPKSTWDSNDWVIVKPLDGEDATPGNRNDFELIITEVTDPTDEGNELIELFSPTGHINHPIKENLFLKRYDDGQSPATKSLPLKGKVIDNKGFIVVCDADEDEDEDGCDLRDTVADLSGKDVVTIESCSDESGKTGCVIVDVFGLLGNAVNTPDFTNGRAYRLPGPVHDMPKSTWDSNDWVILGNVDEGGTTPGNRDDFKLIITEVTDPADDESKFIELFSPYHGDESIPSNYRVIRYIDGKNDSSKQIHDIGSKDLTSGYYVVPVSSTDDIKDLDGEDVVTIEKCVDTVCDIVDVYGIPNYSSDDLKKHDFTDGRAYRLQGPVHDVPKQTWMKNDWVIVKPLDGEDTTRGNRNDFELIITEVTDPQDEKKRFVELYSPSGHINYSIVENLYLKRYDGDSPSPSKSFELKDKFANNNGFIVICASNEGGICQYTDDVADLNGENTVTIEACSKADSTDCEIIDVFGVPGDKPIDPKDQKFTDGRAYRLQGPTHDTPKGIWDSDDWVILKPLDGEDTTPGDRDDFNLIITEVTDVDNFIELHSTNVHNNYPFPDNYFVVKYTGGSLSSPTPTVFPLKDETLDGNSFFVICGAKSNEFKTYCNDNNAVGDLNGGDVVTIEKCVGDEYSRESCEIVDAYGIPGASSSAHHFYDTRAYRKRGNVHDVAKSTYDGDDWVIAEIGTTSTPGNRDDDNCPVANTCSEGEIGIWLSDDDFSCCKPNPLCGNVCEDTYCSCSVEGKNELGILNKDKKCVEVKDAIPTGPSPVPTPAPAPGADTCELKNQFCVGKCSDDACETACEEVGKLSTGGDCCRYRHMDLPLCPYPEDDDDDKKNKCFKNAFCPDVCAGEKCPVSPDQGGNSPSSPTKGGGAPPAKGGKGVSPSKKTTRLRRVRK
ncbi:hypothetical protein CTEN210_11243 [Chaetoceros tenuissimus]|uniref:Uncharacterized protein n=1 Tax=Chaetoceros tenuissimus TaxID=426638 RepID=A0AAD3H8Q6_9STRA|nr:hypothetical protein CTEN210_11243 [Chaetoceros tenuissimus]